MDTMQDMLKNQNLQAVVISNPYNVKFASGFLADYCYLVVGENAKYYFTDGRFIIESHKELSSDWQVVEITTTNAEQKIREVLFEIGAKNVGFDSDISHSDYIFVHDKVLKDFASVDVTDFFVKTRAVKSQYEIDCILKAQQIAEKSLEQVKKQIVEGMTELELCAKLEYLMKINGSLKPSFDTIVAFGENTAIAHAKPSSRKLKKGDAILIDFGATYNGYCSDMTRTFVFEECSKEFEQIYNIVLGANEIAISAMRSGIPPREADRVARNFIDLHGYADCFIHSLGHGVGLEIHEYPRLSVNDLSDDRLLENMVVTIEPGIYLEGKFGVRIEDMIVVKETKALNLTTSNKKLEIIKN